MQFVQGSRALFEVLGRCRVLSVKGQIRLITDFIFRTFWDSLGDTLPV